MRAADLFVRSRTTSLAAARSRRRRSRAARRRAPDDYQDALDRLESAEEVDLVIASVANQLDDAGVRTVHQAVVAHCTKMADVARNRIGLGSVTAERGSARSRRSSTTPTTSAATTSSWPRRRARRRAVAGLLGRQDYFQSPTFKTIAGLDARPAATPTRSSSS